MGAVPLLAVLPFGPNMLANPGFEEVGPKGLPAGWLLYGGSKVCKVEIVPDARSGKKAVKFIDRGPKERNQRYSIGLYQILPAKPEAWYVAAVYVKALYRNHPQAVIMQFTFEPSMRSKAVYLAPPLDGRFHKFLLAAKAPPDAKRMRFYLYTMHYWQSETLLDDAFLTEIPKETASELAPLLVRGSLGIEGARLLFRETPLAMDGRPRAVIVSPDEGRFVALAERLSRSVRRATGTALPIVKSGQLSRSNPAKSLDEIWRRTGLEGHPQIVALGSMLNNVVIERLYWNRYAFCDSLYPGEGGFVIRTVCEPYNFRLKQNVIVLGGSDFRGVERAVREFEKRFLSRRTGDLTIPYTLVVEPRRPPSKADLELLKAIKRGERKAPPDFTKFIRYGRLYFETGELAYAELAKYTLLSCWDRYLDNPEYDMTWPEETQSFDVGLTWDAVEEAPVFSDEERKICTNTLIAFLHSLPRHVYGDWGSLDKNETIIWNHQTFPLMGIYSIARYTRRFYGDLDGKMDFYLSQVRGAFRGQKRSWKPQEDAMGYVLLVPLHTIAYTLCEGDYSYFESGNVKKFAEYMAHVCNNKGWPSGFGDFSYYRGSQLLARILPIAFWFYRDGRYIWWLRRLVPDWRNPFWQDVKSRPWRELAGITVIPLHPLVYEYTKKKPYYGGLPPRPPNVPFDKAFDKIVLRENLDPEGQYLLLDGYAGGKHLHYDGNAIVKCSMLGDDLLIDGDYLVRNTTEHSMVSIVRDGRAAELEPICAALSNMADLETTGFVKTAVFDWNGADWRRNIFWKKGEFFVVLDQLTARKGGDFLFECVWKTLDRKERGEGSWRFDGRALHISIYDDKAPGSIGLEIVRRPDASGGRAVRFPQQWSRLQFALDLPRGEYAVTMIACGLNTGADSFWLSVDGGPKIAFHIPIGKFGPSSSSWTKKEPTPLVRIERGGRHVFTVTLREAPGVMLDKIVFSDKAGKVFADVEAESAPPVPGAPRERPTRDYHIVGDGLARSKITRRRSNVGLPIVKLHQRIRAHLKPGEGRSFINLLYAERNTERKGYDLRRISPVEALILDKSGEPVAYVGVGQCREAREILPIEAEMFMVESDRVSIVNGRRVGEIFRSGRLVSREIVMRSDVLRRALLRLARLTKASRPARPKKAVTKGLRELWRFGGDEPSAVARDVEPLEGEGVVMAKGRQVCLLGPDGSVKWRFEAEGEVNDLVTEKVYGKRLVFAASEDEHVYVLDFRGRLVKAVKIEAPLRVGQSSVRQPRARTVLLGDLDRNGRSELLVGTANANLCCYELSPDLDVNLKWRFDRVPHGTREGMLLDLDKDGELEVLVANKYGGVQVFSADGRYVGGAYSELGDVEFDCADLDGDGKFEIVNGSSTGALKVTEFRGPVEWEFDNYGYSVSDLKIADVDSDGSPEVVVASETGYLYILGPDGKLEAQRDLGDSLRALCVADLDGDGGLDIAVGGDNGRVDVLDGRGKVKATFGLEGRCVGLWAADINGDGRPELLAATDDRGLLCLSAR